MKTEATIKGFYLNRVGNKMLIGCRISTDSLSLRSYPPGTYDVRIESIIRLRKGSRMKGGRFAGRWLNYVYLEDIVTEDYEMD